MLDLQKCYNECKAELDSIGIKYGNIISIQSVNLSPRMWGRCIRDGDVYKIEINKILLESAESYRGLKNTIIHEMLHSCPDSMKHTGNWKNLARIVNSKLGYSISRCSSNEELGVKIDAIEQNYKYACKCDKCGKVLYKNRICDFVRYPSHYVHKNCGGAFIRIK